MTQDVVQFVLKSVGPGSGCQKFVQQKRKQCLGPPTPLSLWCFVVSDSMLGCLGVLLGCSSLWFLGMELWCRVLGDQEVTTTVFFPW